MEKEGVTDGVWENEYDVVSDAEIVGVIEDVKDVEGVMDDVREGVIWDGLGLGLVVLVNEGVLVNDVEGEKEVDGVTE